jgi:hypothetical protein
MGKYQEFKVLLEREGGRESREGKEERRKGRGGKRREGRKEGMREGENKKKQGRKMEGKRKEEGRRGEGREGQADGVVAKAHHASLPCSVNSVSDISMLSRVKESLSSEIFDLSTCNRAYLS